MPSYDEKHTFFSALAAEDFSFNSGKKHAHITFKENSQRWPWEVRDGIFIEANLSAASIMHFIDRLLHEYGVDREAFCVNVVAEEPVEDDEDEITGSWDA